MEWHGKIDSWTYLSKPDSNGLWGGLVFRTWVVDSHVFHTARDRPLGTCSWRNSWRRTDVTRAASVLPRCIDDRRSGTWHLKKHVEKIVEKHTHAVLKFNSCTKCRPGTLHDRTPNCHPFSLAYIYRYALMTSQLNVEVWSASYVGHWCAWLKCLNVFYGCLYSKAVTYVRETVAGVKSRELNICTMLFYSRPLTYLDPCFHHPRS